MDVGGVGEGVMDDSCMRVVVVVAATGSDSEGELPLGAVGVVGQIVDKGAAGGSRLGVGHCVDKLGTVGLAGQSVDKGSIVGSGCDVMSMEVAVGSGENSGKKVSGSRRVVEDSYSGNLASAITAGPVVAMAA